MDTSGTGVELLREGGHLHLCLVDKRSQALFTTPFRQLYQETTEWSQIPYGFFTYGHKEDLKLEEFRLSVSTQWGQQESISTYLLAFRFIVESRTSAMRQSQRHKLRFRSPRWSDQGKTDEILREQWQREKMWGVFPFPCCHHNPRRTHPKTRRAFPKCAWPPPTHHDHTEGQRWQQEVSFLRKLENGKLWFLIFSTGQLQSVFQAPTATFSKSFHIRPAPFQTGLCTVQHKPGTNQFWFLHNFDGIISLSMIYSVLLDTIPTGLHQAK